MEKAVIQYNEARARLMMDIIPPAALRAASRSALAYNTRISRKREYIRTIFLLFAVSLLTLMAFSAARASTTISYFNDSELAVLNTLQAGMLNFAVNPSAVEIFVGPDVAGSQNIATQIIPDLDSFTLKYKITTAFFDGDLEFCNALQLNTVSGPFTYSGSLVDFDTGETSDNTSLVLNVSFPLGDPNVQSGDSCVVEIIHDAWAMGETEGDGYSDGESFIVTIHAVISEPLQLQSAFSADVQTLEIPSEPPVEDGEEGRALPDETNERGEERSGERGAERERTAEPPAEVIVETVDIPPAAETPAVTETLPVPEGEPGV